MAEEQKWQEPGGHTLCPNNCGFFGSPTTHNLCSKCYKDHCVKEQQLSEAKVAVEKSLALPKSEAEFSASASSVSVSPDPVISAEKPPVEAAVKPSRCAACRRRVGLTGFTCRCGTMFCGTHRYPEQHACTFDFKALGKEEITKANPVVKADKVQRI